VKKPEPPQQMAEFTGSLASYSARWSFFTYLGAIACGTGLLALPAARAPGQPPLSVIDAAFTATSACCVTGLTVRSTAEDFSPFGQGVILLLIQLGGLGIMTITTLLLFQMGGEATVRQRAVIAETLGIKSGRGIRKLALTVLLVVLASELVGFVLLSLATWGSREPLDVVWRAAFHSVSAFCNAGFSLGDDSLVAYDDNVAINLIICGLVIVGGLGFPVLFDIASRLRRREPLWERLHMHSKLMLLGTAVLLTFGAVSFWIIEWDGILVGRPLSTRVLLGLFHSTTCRTAGFNTVDYGTLSSATLFLTILLMAIGAGPGSTGGGFKVSTFMTLLVRAGASFRGQERANFAKRTIPEQAVERATATALIFGAIAVAALVALLVVENGRLAAERPRWFLDALFECISALGTVGLSTGITAALSVPGKSVLIILMLLGRLGPITVAVALSRQRPAYQPNYPEEEPLVG
jgi:trk system potassium uptake protein TrkH